MGDPAVRLQMARQLPEATPPWNIGCAGLVKVANHSLGFCQLKVFADGDRHTAAADAEFGEDVFQMKLNGRFRKSQFPGDLLVASSFG